jgi:hypothetical protein
MSSLSCWKPSSTSPFATSEPTGTPGGACTILLLMSSAMPQRSNSLASCTPLGPVEYPSVRASTTAWRSAASLPISGRGAPARTAMATPERTRSTLLPANDTATRNELVDRVGGQDHDVERLAGLHAFRRIDSADRFDGDLGPVTAHDRAP